MIAIIEESFVPVWINVRTTSLPRRAWVKDVLINARIDADYKIADPFSMGFFVRSVALTPDGETVLNRKASTFGASFMAGVAGDHGYAITDTGDYLSMMRKALERFDEKHGEEKASLR